MSSENETPKEFPVAMTPKEELAELDRQEKAIGERRRQIYAESLKAAEKDKICSDYVAKFVSERDDGEYSVQYPISVTRIDWGHHFFTPNKNGAYLVRIRPCGKQYESKTFLGIHLGNLSLHASVSYNKETGILHAEPGMLNPAIYIPSLNQVVFGCESWWGRIKSEDDFKAITDETINKTWYVQALKKIDGTDEA